MQRNSLLLLFSLFFLSNLSSQIIYVAPDSSGVGTKEDPAGLTDAITNMQSTGTHYRLDTGYYQIDSALLIVHPNVLIEGGFISSERWIKTSEAGATTIHRSGINSRGDTTFTQGIIGIDWAAGLSELLVQDIKLIVDSPDPSTYVDSGGFGISTYGIRSNGNSEYRISRCIIEVGEASDGEDAIPGADGMNGSDGQDGSTASGGNGGDGGSHFSTLIGGPGGARATTDEIEVVDQSHVPYSFTTPDQQNWQSFTVGKSGVLSRIGFTIGPTNYFRLQIHQGEGTSGTILYDIDFNPSAAMSSLSYEEFLMHDPVYLEQDSQYTLSIVSAIPWAYDNDNYADGTSSLGSSFDFSFKTFIMGQAESGSGGSFPAHYSDGSGGGGGGGTTLNNLLTISGHGGGGGSQSGQLTESGTGLYPYGPLYFLLDGQNGVDGVDGANGTVNDASFLAYYNCGWGNKGEDGQGGSAGGGGGGGLDDDSSISYGGGGGGGGASGGLGASQSYGGGGAFGIYIYDNGQNGHVSSCMISVGFAGTGGAGAIGGAKGLGGINGNTVGSANQAGNGGEGGDGGIGGNSPDAPDGTSEKVYLASGMPLIEEETDIRIDTFPILLVEEALYSGVSYVVTSDTMGIWGFSSWPSDHFNLKSYGLYNSFNFSGLEYKGFVITSQSLPCPTGGGYTIYVDKNATGGNTGDSWSDALTDLQLALETAQACQNVVEIWVASDTYYPSRRNRYTEGNFETFLIHEDLKLYGGFTGTENSLDERPMVDGKLDPAYYTILSGDLMQNDLDPNADGLIDEIIDSLDNVYHIMTIEQVSDYTEIGGFAFTGGYANGKVFGHHRSAAAVFLDGRMSNTNPVFKDCNFFGNISENNGGAIYMIGNTASRFEDCNFLKNKSYASGGAVSSNANSNPYPAYTCEPYYLNCAFKGNSSSFQGGAVLNSSWESGITHSTFVQCLFSGNRSTSSANQGSCIANFGLFGNSTTKILNSTFAGNAGNLFNDEYATTELINSIVYSNRLNGAAVYDGIGNNLTINHSIVQGAAQTGTVYNVDPEFVDNYAQKNPNGFIPNIQGDYRVKTCSSALDMGSNALYQAERPDSMDYSHQARFLQGYSSDINLDPTESIIDLGPWESQSPLMFTATRDSTDAWVNLNWEVVSGDCACIEEDPFLKLGVTVQLKTGNQLIDSWVIFPEDYEDSNYTFSYRDEVGPDLTRDYVLEFRKTGPGTLNCRQVERGNTLPFRQVSGLVVSDAERVDSIKLSWKNNSTLTNAFNVYRDGTLIKTLAADNTLGKEYFYNDVFRFSANSLVNGESYDYCIETVSTIYSNIYNTNIPDLSCDPGSTIDINFQASDNTHNNKVAMSWDDVSAYANQIRIVRDGRALKSLGSASLSFDDQMPVHGRQNIYGVELLRNSVPFVGSYDYGETPPNGIIAGHVLNAQQKVAVRDVEIKVEWTLEDSNYVETAFTDFKGHFGFDNLYYGETSEFTLTAEYGEESFELNPIEVALDLESSERSDLVFLLELELDDPEVLTVIDTLIVTTQPTKDLVEIEWAFEKAQSTDTLYFNIYRNSDLIAQACNTDVSTALINMTYEDLGGIPGSTNDYTLHAYQINQNTLKDTSLSKTNDFPIVAPVAGFSVSENPVDGLVENAWIHTSANFNGFRLYREYVTEKLIQELPDSVFAYNDRDGRPGEQTGYYITSYRTVDGIDYESVRLGPVTVNYPELTPVSNMNIFTLSTKDILRLTYEIPTVYNPNYAYEGVNIYRTSNGLEEQLASIDKELLIAGQMKIYEDKTGVPLQDYTYEIKPYKLSCGQVYEIESAEFLATFPDVSIPTNLTATSLEGRIRLEWSSPHTSENSDGFIIYKGAGVTPDSVGILPYQYSNSFTDNVNNPPVNQSQTYQVATIRYVDGVRYLSNRVTVVADPPLTNGDEAINLKNFTASTDQATHIVLCWEWCEPADLTPFVIRREGVIIDTVPNAQRSYYDYDAPPTIDQEYSIETPGINDQHNYQKIYATGRRPGHRSIQGKVYKSSSYAGVPNVDIEVVMSGAIAGIVFKGKAKTDSSGYYQVKNLTFMPPDLYTTTVYAEGANSNIPGSPKIIGITHTDTTKVYEANFEDIRNDNFSGLEIDSITFITAISDPENMGINISWTATGENYDGFEVYRGTDLLGEVLKGEELVWTDTKGVPGLLSIYNVRAFLTGPVGRDYSDFATAATEFPKLLAIENLKATPLILQNKLELNWTHKYDSHDRYIITRNGDPFDVFDTGNPLSVIDSTGVPGTTYNYEITAVKGAIFSETVGIKATLPVVEPIRSTALNVTAPTIEKALELGGGLVETSRNHILLEWDYTERASDYFNIYRFIYTGSSKTEEQLVGRVRGNVRSYKDYTGVPNQLYNYDVVPVVERLNNSYYANRRIVWSKDIIFPQIHPPTHMRITPDTMLGVLNIDFLVDFPGSDGYRIYRDGDLIYENMDSSFSETVPVDQFVDKTGYPGQEYSYEARLFTSRRFVDQPLQEFESDPAEITINYPLPPRPGNFEVTKGVYPNKILLSWDYNKAIPVDNFIIERRVSAGNWDYIAQLEAGERTYDDMDINFSIPPDNYLEIEYRVKAVNQTVSSPWVVDFGFLYNGIIIGGIDAPYRGLGGYSPNQQYGGRSIDIDGEWAVAGTNGYGINIYHLNDDNTWVLYDTKGPSSVGLLPDANNDCFGCEVSLSGKYIVTSAKYANQNKGGFYIYERNNINQWNLMQSVTPDTIARKAVGFRVDIYDNTGLSGNDYLVASNGGPNNSLYLGGVQLYRRNGTSWDLIDEILGDPFEFNLGYELSLYKDRMVAYVVPDLDGFNYYSVNPNGFSYLDFWSFEELDYLELDGNGSSNEFQIIAGGIEGNFSFERGISFLDGSGGTLGFDQSFENTSTSASIFGDYAAYGNGPSVELDLLKKVGGSWTFQRVENPDPNFSSASFGEQVALSDEFIMVSDPDALGGRGYIDFIPLFTVEPPEDVEATDGTQPGQVLVSWTEPADPNIQSYKVFRDGQYLTSVPAIGPGNQLTHPDLPSSGLLPGKHYMYQVEAFASGVPSKSIGDEGWIPPNGTISGDLTTLIGNAPIEGGEIIAEVNIDGDCITYTATTDIFGHYEIDSIYYGAESNVVVRCSYMDHDIISQQSASLSPQLDSITVTLDVNANSYTNANFLDKTAYAISGKTRHDDITDCFLDSIKLTRIYSVFQNGVRTRVKEEKYTDENGDFTFIVDPETPGLDSILICADNMRYFDVQNGMPQDSICYDFEGASDNANIQNDHPEGYLYITNFDLDKFTEVEFLDQTTYPVTIKVLNSCGNSLLNSSDNWTITASSKDGCYSKSFKTNGGSTALNELPPKDYVFTVSDVSDYSNLDYLDFLEYLINAPVSFDIDSFHRSRPKNMTIGEIASALTFTIEYHKPAVVTPDLSELSFLCGDATREAIVDENDSYTIPVNVVEGFTPPCAISSGYVLVTNAAAKDPSPVRLDYDDVQQKFQDYTFTAGEPNPVLPHTWNLKFEYFTDSGIFQGSYSHAVFVKGDISLPGSGIFTDASADLSEVPLPLYVLRDPPGDRSYSAIKAGHTSTKTFSFEDVSGGGAGAYGEFGFTAVGIGFEGSANVTAGRYNGDNIDLNITTTITEEISTEGGLDDGNISSINSTGRSASIIVGAGLVMQYGITNEYDIDCTGNEAEITETRSVEFTPLEIKTTWTYTVGFIEQLISEYASTIQSIDRTGLPKLKKPDGTEYTPAKAKNIYVALKSNWEKVLEYFDNQTNPLYSMTQTNFEDGNLYPEMELETGNSITSLNFEANLWKSHLKQSLPSNYLDPDYVMDQEDIDTYNNAATAIRELMHVRHFTDEDEEIREDVIDAAYQNWHYTDARFNNSNYYKSVSGYNPDEAPAENLTFSGLTSQTRTYAQEKSNTSSSNTNIYVNSDIKLGVVFQQKVDMFIGFGGGVITKLVDSNNRLGAQTTINWYTNETYTESSTDFEQIEYTLSDNDDGDELSVTVIKGLEANHTPLFQGVGGRTSCPYEEYTMSRDDPVIQVLKPENGSAGKNANLFFQDPDTPAEFTINITNNSPTEETRDVEVFIDNNSNPDGAVVRLGGSILGTQEYTSLDYNNPLSLILTVDRGQAYDYTGLRIGVRPTCTDTLTDFITLNVKFQSPCSPVSIVTPDDNWLINGQRRNLIVSLRDYEPQTPNFDGLELQYRKLGEGTLAPLTSGWKKIPHTSILPTDNENNPVPATVLSNFNAGVGVGVIPTYKMVWSPDEGNASLFTDGTYQIRAKSTCTEGLIKNFRYSNYVFGVIDRENIQVFGTPEPADGVWIPGDEVSVQFNKNIDCSLLNDADGFLVDSLRVYVDGVLLDPNNPATRPTFTCFNNKILMTLPDMSVYDGQTLTVNVENITDVNGNYAIQTDAFNNTSRNIEWDFLVVTSKAYWERDSIVVELYEGETIDVSVGLRNTDNQSALSNINIMRTTASASWLDIDPEPASTFSINPSAVRQVQLSFTGQSVGVEYDTLKVNNLPGSGRIPELPIKLITSKRPPYPPDWTVDGNQYPNSMTVVTNYRYGADGDLSTDTLDQISVWIDNTLRGLGRIQQSGEEYIAYLTVYGNAQDVGDTLEFRVWDQSTDTEYDAFTDPNIAYSNNAFEGTSFDPRILEIDSIADRARYIHLNQGYTWISFNSVSEDMSANAILGSLDRTTQGDRIKHQNEWNEFQNDEIGWYVDPESGTRLDSFSTEKAYMVYLQNGPDSIRLTGIDAEPFTRLFTPGTHWIGFPSQVPALLEDAVEVNNLTFVEQIKNKDESRISDGTDWTSGLLTELKPNEGYKLLLSDDKVVTVPGSGVTPFEPDNPFITKSSAVLADPMDPSTWNIDIEDYTFADVLPVVGRMLDDGNLVTDDGSRIVAAFINGELRGVAHINELAVLSDHLFTLFIGINDGEGTSTVDLHYSDGLVVSRTLVLDISSLSEAGLGVYNYSSPFLWDTNGQVTCVDDLVLSLDDSPLSGLYEARLTITVNGNVTTLNGADVTLSAPEVILNEVETQTGAVFEILQTGCNE